MIYMADQSIMKKLEDIQKQLKAIQERMVDADSIMTEEDYTALLDYRTEKKAGKLVSHGQLRKELGLDA